MWTMLVPFLVTAYWGCYVKRGVELPKGLPEMILFLTMLLRFLCGYEFTTTIMLASEVPIAYYLMKAASPQERKKWFWIAFRIGVLELAAFALSFGVLGIQSMLYAKTDFITATKKVIEAAKFRTGTFENVSDLAVYEEGTDPAAAADIISKVKNATGWSTLKFYLLSDVKIWGVFDFRKLLLLTTVALTMKAIVCKSEIKQAGIELLLLFLSAVPAASWYYIGYGHAIFHEHVDYVLWDIPFLPICMALLFHAFGDMYKTCKEKRK